MRRAALVAATVVAVGAAGVSHCGTRFLTRAAVGGGTAVAGVQSPAIAPPALPLAPGAKVMGFGHSYIDREAQSPAPHSATYPDLVGGVQVLARGVLPYVDALDRAEAQSQGHPGRFDIDLCFDASGTKQVNSPTSALSCAHQGFYGDTVQPLLVAGKPGTLVRTPYIVGRQPGIVYLDIGLNDLRLPVPKTAVQLEADLDRQIATLTSRGIWVVVQTLSYPQDRQADYSGVPLVNAWIKAQSGRAGVMVADTIAMDGTAAAPAAAFGNDRLHLSPAGARARALVVKSVLQTMVSPATASLPGALDAANLLPWKGLPGTGGTLTNATGTAATGFNLARVIGTSSYAGSKRVVAAGNECQDVTVTASDNGAAYHVFGLKPTAATTFATLGLAAGDWYETDLTVTLDGWEGWNVTASDQPVVTLYDEQSTTNINDLFWSSSNFSGFPGRTALVRMLGQVQPGATQMRWSNRWLQIYHLSAGLGGTSGVAEVCAPMLRKVADPRTAWNLP